MQKQDFSELLWELDHLYDANGDRIGSGQLAKAHGYEPRHPVRRFPEPISADFRLPRDIDFDGILNEINALRKSFGTPSTTDNRRSEATRRDELRKALPCVLEARRNRFAQLCADRGLL